LARLADTPTLLNTVDEK
jgi:hypothetical protein